MKTRSQLALLLTIAMLLLSFAGCAKSAPTQSYTAGSYTASAPGMSGPVSLTVTVSADRIEKIEIGDNYETPGIGSVAKEQVPASIIAHQSLAVDTVAGATLTSRAILAAAEDCLAQAGGNIEQLKADLGLPKERDVTKSADVIIVGGGGAGLSAAVAATEAGASVILIEKQGFLGGNSIVSGGIYNTPDEKQKELPAQDLAGAYALTEKEARSEQHKQLMATLRQQLDQHVANGNKYLFDSVELFILQTYDGGDYVGNLDHIQQFCSKAYSGLEWLKGMGLEFADTITQGTGSLWPRTHKTVKPNGVGYIEVFTNQLANSKCEILMNTKADSLITDAAGAVTGVNAIGKDGEKVTLNGRVIMCTGGFAGNVEMRVEYCQGEKWPDLGPSIKTTNVAGVSGEGLLIAQAAGADLINMEQIQLLQVCNPWTGIASDYTEAVGVEGQIFVNNNGERFTNEGGRRDVVSKAIMAQPEGKMWVLISSEAIPDPAAITNNSGVPMNVLCENNISGYATFDTLEALAEYIGCEDVSVLKATLDAFDAHVDSQEADEFGRILFKKKMNAGPWYVYPRSPAAHHTMGGVNIDLDARALDRDGKVIKGLYAAGEITGVLHGGNRLGGNAIVDFTLYGKIAGTAAATDPK